MKDQYIHIDENGYKYFYSDKEMQKLHRENGPAVEYADGYKEWHVNDEYLTEDQFNAKMRKEIVLTLDEIAAKFGVEVNKLKIKK